MKKLVNVVEVENEGLLALIGENVILLCGCYFYAGKLVGVNETCVLLENAQLVYETGAWDKNTFADAQKLPANWYVQISAVESFGRSGR